MARAILESEEQSAGAILIFLHLVLPSRFALSMVEPRLDDLVNRAHCAH